MTSLPSVPLITDDSAPPSSMISATFISESVSSIALATDSASLVSIGTAMSLTFTSVSSPTSFVTSVVISSSSAASNLLSTYSITATDSATSSAVTQDEGGLYSSAASDNKGVTAKTLIIVICSVVGAAILLTLVLFLMRKFPRKYRDLPGDVSEKSIIHGTDSTLEVPLIEEPSLAADSRSYRKNKSLPSTPRERFSRMLFEPTVRYPSKI
ncbi:hypothetical protein V1511DRAFT_509005 [Dipodascopsis uninucleata]